MPVPVVHAAADVEVVRVAVEGLHALERGVVGLRCIVVSGPARYQVHEIRRGLAWCHAFKLTAWTLIRDDGAFPDARSDHAEALG